MVPPDDILSPPFSISESSSNKKHDDLSDLLYIDLVTKNQNITNEYKKVDISFLTKFLNGSIGWEMISNNESGSQILVKEYHFDNFPESVKFSYKVSQLAQMLNHHPAVTIDWNKVKIELVTWSLNNKISNLDIKSAVLIDEMYNSMY